MGKKSRSAASRKHARKKRPRVQPQQAPKEPAAFQDSLRHDWRSLFYRCKPRRITAKPRRPAKLPQKNSLLRQDYLARLELYGIVQSRAAQQEGMKIFLHRRQESGIRFRYVDLKYTGTMLLEALLLCAFFTALAVGCQYILYESELLSIAFFLSLALCFIPGKVRRWITLGTAALMTLIQGIQAVTDGPYTLLHAGEALNALLTTESCMLLWTCIRWSYSAWRTLLKTVDGYITAEAYRRGKPIDQPEIPLDKAWRR